MTMCKCCGTEEALPEEWCPFDYCQTCYDAMPTQGSYPDWVADLVEKYDSSRSNADIGL